MNKFAIIFTSLLLSLSALADNKPLIQVLDVLAEMQTGTTSEDIQLQNKGLDYSVTYFKLNSKAALPNGLNCNKDECLVSGFKITDKNVEVNITVIPNKKEYNKQYPVKLPVGSLNAKNQIEFSIPNKIKKIEKAFNACLLGCSEKRPDRVYIELF